MQRFKSAADFATAELRRRILVGDLKPGARLDQVELAAELDLSRHPVRQAIERLAERGFVEIRPHRSAVVSELSLSDMDELYHARIELETLALREGWPRFDAQKVADVAALHRKLRAVSAARNIDGYMALNRAFHLALYEPCANRHILRATTALFDLSERYHRTALQTRHRVERSRAEHDAMLQALESRDLDRLLTLIRDHNEGTQAAVRERMVPEQPRAAAPA